MLGSWRLVRSTGEWSRRHRCLPVSSSPNRLLLALPRCSRCISSVPDPRSSHPFQKRRYPRLRPSLRLLKVHPARLVVVSPGWRYLPSGSGRLRFRKMWLPLPSIPWTCLLSLPWFLSRSCRIHGRHRHRCRRPLLSGCIRGRGRRFLNIRRPSRSLLGTPY